MADTFVFEKDFATGEVLCVNVGRIYLRNGNTVRLYFGPGGLRMIVPRGAFSDGTITLLDQVPFVEGKHDA